MNEKKNACSNFHSTFRQRIEGKHIYINIIIRNRQRYQIASIPPLKSVLCGFWHWHVNSKKSRQFRYFPQKFGGKKIYDNSNIYILISVGTKNSMLFINKLACCCLYIRIRNYTSTRKRDHCLLSDFSLVGFEKQNITRTHTSN